MLRAVRALAVLTACGALGLAAPDDPYFGSGGGDGAWYDPG